VLTFAMMAAIRYHANDTPPQKTTLLDQKTKDTPPSPPLIGWSVQEIKRIAVRIAQRRIQPA